MLQKYLDLIKKAIEKLTSLGGTNNTWGDYFQTVGFEFMVLLLGIAYVAAVVLIIAIPTVGLVKTAKIISMRDTFCNLKLKAGDLRELHNRISKFADHVDDVCTSKPDSDKIYKNSDKIAKEKAANDSDPYNSELRTAFLSVLLMMKKHGIETVGFAKDVTDTSFDFNFDLTGFSWIGLKEKILKLYPLFESSSVYSMCLFVENGIADMSESISNTVKDISWDRYGDFKALGKLGNTKLEKFMFRYGFKLVGACAGVLIIYAIFVVPLILMLFK